MIISRKESIDFIEKTLECAKVGNKEDNINFLKEVIDLVNNKFEWSFFEDLVVNHRNIISIIEKSI